MKIKKVLRFSITLITVVSFLLMPLISNAQNDNWEILFNGKDLSGWRELNGKHIWEVSDGMIVGTTVPGEPNGFLCTEKQFGDFVLELEVSIDTLMNNSGIQFRSLSYPEYNNSRLHGYQMEVDPKSQQWSGAIYEEGGNRGWIYTGDQLSEAAKKAFKRDNKDGFEWNKYRIECVGTTIRTWINDIPAAHLIDEKFLRGMIGLQLHANQANDPVGSYKVRFRNIRIQTGNFKTSPFDNTFVVNLIPNNLSSQEELNGYSLLWDGKSLQNWIGSNGSTISKNDWLIGDEELVSLKRIDPGTDNYANIRSRSQYGAFELKFDFKLSDGAKGGIKYLADESEEKSLIVSVGYGINDNHLTLTNKQVENSLANVLDSKKIYSSLKRPNEWNQALIKVSGNDNVEYWVNGNKILDYELESEKTKDLTLKNKYSKLVLPSKGHILLENNGSVVSYRSIKIKELK